MACTPQDLATASKCFMCLSEKQLMAIIAYGSCAFGGGGGGGGGDAHDTGIGSPEGVVTADVGAIYFDTAANSMWYKKTGTATNTGWVQLIA